MRRRARPPAQVGEDATLHVTNHLTAAFSSVVLAYHRAAPAMTLTDVLDVGDGGSELAHAYVHDGAAVTYDEVGCYGGHMRNHSEAAVRRPLCRFGSHCASRACV